ncbi:MAG: hypothetical protein CM1200mP28_13810 [Deltaproteobacteria bacterium]|nr:MAG: hypothetical protein CM1200mP28_13810 [Deltaproteobacteria bacterium]
MTDAGWLLMIPHNYHQRTSPEMALLKTEIVDRTLILNAPGMAELQLPLFQTEGIPQMVEIWEDRCEALQQINKQKAG